MVDTKELTKQLTGIVGLYPSINAGGELPADYHREPEVYLEDAHRLLRADIIAGLGPNLPTVRPQPYDASTYFRLFDIVTDSNGVFYESQTAQNQNNPLTDSEHWKQTTALSAWFGRMERGAISKLVLQASGSPATAPLLDNQQLFHYEGNRSDTLNKSGRFVGWRVLVNGNDTALEIVKAGLQFTGELSNFPIYVFHSTADEPVETIRISGRSTGRSFWADVNKCLYQRVGGYYIIGYYEDDLPDNVFAIGALRGFTAATCSSCGGGLESALYEARAPYVALQPISVNGPVTSGVMDWDNVSEIQIASQSWGLNLIIAAKCDATRAILRNKDLFTQALLYMIACDVLQDMSTNDRVNVLSKNMTSQAFVALNGQKDTNDKGLKEDRNKAIADLKDVLGKISPCTPVKARVGINFGSVW